MTIKRISSPVYNFEITDESDPSTKIEIMLDTSKRLLYAVYNGTKFVGIWPLAKNDESFLETVCYCGEPAILSQITTCKISVEFADEKATKFANIFCKELQPYILHMILNEGEAQGSVPVIKLDNVEFDKDSMVGMFEGCSIIKSGNDEHEKMEFNIGDNVYYKVNDHSPVTRERLDSIQSGKISEIQIRPDGIKYCVTDKFFRKDEIGVKFFKTREEAEKLAETKFFRG